MATIPCSMLDLKEKKRCLCYLHESLVHVTLGGDSYRPFALECSGQGSIASSWVVSENYAPPGTL